MDYSDKPTVIISWAAVESDFNARYNDIYLKSFSKVYLDYSGKIIGEIIFIFSKFDSLLLKSVICRWCKREMERISVNGCYRLCKLFKRVS